MVPLFGFKSENAMKYDKKGADHQKSWTLCTIAREALTKELLVSYVRHELRNGTPTTTERFLKCLMLEENCQNPNYIFMCDLVLDSTFMFKDSTRKGDPAWI